MLCVHVCACVCESWVLIHISIVCGAWVSMDESWLAFFLLPQANGQACVDFGCTHPIDGFVLKSTCLLVGFLLKIWMLGNWFNHCLYIILFFGLSLAFLYHEVSYHYVAKASILGSLEKVLYFSHVELYQPIRGKTDLWTLIFLALWDKGPPGYT